jgi:hypothetical protein
MAVRPPLLRLEAAPLPPIEAHILGELTPPRQIAEDADLLAAYLQAREVLTTDIRRFWGGIVLRSGGDSADRGALADLAEVLRDTGEAYSRDAETARATEKMPEWACAAEARASLYAEAFRVLRRLVRGGAAA